MSTKFIKGLKQARFGFSVVLEHLKKGDDVVIIEYDRAQKAIGGYKMVALTPDEYQKIAETEPTLNIPKPLALPTFTGLPLPPKAQ